MGLWNYVKVKANAALGQSGSGQLLNILYNNVKTVLLWAGSISVEIIILQGSYLLDQKRVLEVLDLEWQLRTGCRGLPSCGLTADYCNPIAGGGLSREMFYKWLSGKRRHQWTLGASNVCINTTVCVRSALWN